MKRLVKLLLLILILGGLVAAVRALQSKQQEKINHMTENVPSFTLSATDFTNNSAIPSQYTCDGANTPPTLQISNPPSGTKSLALVVDDPDSPSGLWTHWIVFNLPPQTTTLAALPRGTIQGKNTFGNIGYGGPCPGSGVHHYIFRLYALDISLPEKNYDRSEFDAQIKDHILARTILVGTYQRSKR